MNRDQRKRLIASIVVENSNETRSMPISVGDVLVFDANAENFTQEVPPANGIGAWTRINAEEGAISATQLLRKGNGISLDGDDNTTRLRNLIDVYGDDDAVFSVLIYDEKIRKVSDGNDRHYYKLRVISGRAENAEAFA